jgi:NAD(P)-dependent dehydrogenase (short-subunit alcohol dehydrogenase family)
VGRIWPRARGSGWRRCRTRALPEGGSTRWPARSLSRSVRSPRRGTTGSPRLASGSGGLTRKIWPACAFRGTRSPAGTGHAATYVDWAETPTAADLSQSRAVMDINLYGPWRMIQAMHPLLRASDHPRIVNIASGAASHGDQRYGPAARRGAAASCGVSKAALLALTATVVAELDGTPVIVNAVDPGLTATWPGAEAMAPGP